MNIIYAKGFALAWKEIRHPVAPAKAARAHNRRKRYTAVLYEHPICLTPEEYIGQDVLHSRMPDGQTPFASIEIKDDYVGMEFFDDLVRPFMDYQYIEREPGRVFLVMGGLRSFIEDTDEVDQGKTWIFKEDGSVVITSGEYRRDAHMDVSGQWKSYPMFGHYDHLLDVDWGYLSDH